MTGIFGQLRTTTTSIRNAALGNTASNPAEPKREYVFFNKELEKQDIFIRQKYTDLANKYNITTLASYDVNSNGIVDKDEEFNVRQTIDQAKRNLTKPEQFSIAMQSKTMRTADIIDEIYQNKNVKNPFKTYSNLLLNYYKSNNIYCGDIEEYINNQVNKGLNINLQKKYLKYFSDKLHYRMMFKNEPNKYKLGNGKWVTPNGKFTHTAKQNYLGDCWFLSTVNSLALKAEGRKKLKNLLEISAAEQCVYVKFPSVGGRGIKIPFEELYSASEFCNNNINIRAIEMAAEKYMLNRATSTDLIKAGARESIKSPMDGGTPRYALAILFDKEVSPLKYLDNSLVAQLPYTADNKYSFSSNAIFGNILNGYKPEDSKKAWEEYHDFARIKKELAAGKIVAVLRTSLLNNGESSEAPDHVQSVKGFTRDGRIIILDPYGEIKKYTQEEFNKNFPIVTIDAPVGEPVCNFKITPERIISLIPAHFLSSEGAVSVQEMFRALNDDKQYANELKNTILQETNSSPYITNNVRNVAYTTTSNLTDDVPFFTNTYSRGLQERANNFAADFASTAVSSSKGIDLIYKAGDLYSGGTSNWWEITSLALDVYGQNKELSKQLHSMSRDAANAADGYVTEYINKNFTEINLGFGVNIPVSEEVRGFAANVSGKATYVATRVTTVAAASAADGAVKGKEVKRYVTRKTGSKTLGYLAGGYTAVKYTVDDVTYRGTRWVGRKVKNACKKVWNWIF